jgi:hypothetical protein
MAKRPCAFCPEPATTGEHIWSNWVNPLLGEKRKYVIHQEIEGRSWISIGLHQKFPVLCGTCNSAWGGSIETLMKNVSSSMVKNGDRALLNAEDLYTISIYTQLKAFVSDYSQQDSDVASFYDIRERRAFRDNFAIPSGTNIWLARTFDDHGVFKASYGKSPINSPKRFHVHIFTVSLGQLLIQLTSVRWTKKSNRKFAAPPFLTQHHFWDRLSIPIYPKFSVPVDWPPLHRLGDDSLNEFVYRWKTLNRAY